MQYQLRSESVKTVEILSGSSVANVSEVMSRAVGVFVVKAAGDLLFLSGGMSKPRGSLLAPGLV